MYFLSGEKEECYGCRGCEEVCPQKCITIVEDEEHFVYPHIDEDKCRKCHLCEKVCPSNYSSIEADEDFEQEAWVGVSNSEKVQIESSSGGAFTAIYRSLLAENYRIFGVRWDENLKVIHDMATTEEECEKFRKSKYIMSNTNGCFSSIAMLLTKGEKVCFTASPCQCAALQAFLQTKRINQSNLIVIDLICHGAPSQYIFDKYITEKIGTNRKLNECSYQFRNKTPYRGKVNSRTALFKSKGNKDEVLTAQCDPFVKGYYGRLFYRPSCGVCRFATPDRISDITLGDAWHIEKEYPEWDALKGVSCIIFNTKKGLTLLEDMRKQMTLKKMSIEWVKVNNMQFSKPTEMHKNRDLFFKLLKLKSFEESVNSSMKKPLLIRIVRKICSILGH